MHLSWGKLKSLKTECVFKIMEYHMRLSHSFI